MNAIRSIVTLLAAVATLGAAGAAAAGQPASSPRSALAPGQTFELAVPADSLPPTLHALFNAAPSTPCVTVRLPVDYAPDKSFPVVLYLPGNDGRPKGNLDNAIALAGPQGWIAAALPLFKQSVDRAEPGGGVIVSLTDYSVVSRAYRALLGRLFEAVPNIDRTRSAIVGFSNGAITLGVLLSQHDEFVLTHFRQFCLVDHGMFHLVDLHKRLARDARYLLLVGDRLEYGREVKNRQAQLQQDAWRLLGIDITARVLADTGHQFDEPVIRHVREWLAAPSATAAPPAALPAGTTPPPAPR